MAAGRTQRLDITNWETTTKLIVGESFSKLSKKSWVKHKELKLFLRHFVNVLILETWGKRGESKDL